MILLFQKNPKLSFIVSFVLLIGVIALGGHYTRSSFLQKHAEMSAVDWAHHISKRMPSLGFQTNIPEYQKVEIATKMGALGRLMLDIIADSKVYQIDLINSDCFCDVTVGGYKSPANIDDHASSQSTIEKGSSNPKLAALVSRQQNYQTGLKLKNFKHILLNLSLIHI